MIPLYRWDPQRSGDLPKFIAPVKGRYIRVVQAEQVRKGIRMDPT